MSRGTRTEDVDNNGPAASGGTVTFLNEFNILGGDTLTLNDGTDTHIITFSNLGGGSTDKNTVDIGGGATKAQIAGHLETAVNLAQVALDITITATSSGDVTTLVHDDNGANNNALVTTLGDTAATVVGLSGGSDDVGAPRFTAVDLTDVNHANHAQAAFKSITLQNTSTGSLLYGFHAAADPTTSTGNWNTLVAGASVTLSFDPVENVQQIYLNGAGLSGIQYSYSYTVL